MELTFQPSPVCQPGPKAQILFSLWLKTGTLTAQGRTKGEVGLVLLQVKVGCCLSLTKYKCRYHSGEQAVGFCSRPSEIDRTPTRGSLAADGRGRELLSVVARVQEEKRHCSGLSYCMQCWHSLSDPGSSPGCPSYDPAPY